MRYMTIQKLINKIGKQSSDHDFYVCTKFCGNPLIMYGIYPSEPKAVRFRKLAFNTLKEGKEQKTGLH